MTSPARALSRLRALAALVGALLVLVVLLLPTAAGALASPAAAAAARAKPGPGTTTISVGNAGRSVDVTPVTKGLVGGAWEGFGINWNGVPYDNVRGPITSGRRGLGNPAWWSVLPWSRDAQQLKVDEQRLLALHPAYVRMSWSIDWFDPSYRAGRYQWNTTAMKDRLEDLTFLSAHDIPVIAGMWPSPAGTITYGSPQWAQIEAALVSHLIKTWKFTNIKYWIGVNEPNGICPQSNCNVNFSSWTAATNQLYAALHDDGLLSQVQLIGPTVSPPFPWTEWQSTQGSVRNWATRLSHDPTLKELGAVDWHQYLWTNKQNLPPKGTQALRILLAHRVQKATARIVHDIHSGPYGAGKKTFISEFGFGNVSRSTKDGTPSFDFSLAMVNYGMEIARSGVTGASVWELDPDIPGFRIASDGLWSSKAPFAPYSMYQAMALLFRAVPAGSVVEPAAAPSRADLNVLAARIPRTAGEKVTAQGSTAQGGTAQASTAQASTAQGWSVLIVNNSASGQWVRLRGLTGAGDLYQYDLSAAHPERPLSEPLAPDFVVLNHGTPATEVAPHSVTLLTS